MALDPLRVAMWRFEQIGPFLDERLTPAERRRLMEAAARVPVLWPSGREEPVRLSTLYRWCKTYQDDPRIESLMPKERGRTVRPQAVRPEWLQYALALLEEEPARSLFVLLRSIQDRFDLPRPPARASLHRALQEEPRYAKLRKRARGEARVRRRFQASAPHEIWHADAKARFRVAFADGTRAWVYVLSLLDDASRYVLRALVVESESLKAAVATFRQAAARHGLPRKFYADRGSAYDSDVFRKGLAMLGIHRINTRSRNPSAHGKIEAYHRALHRWFVKELAHQKVADLAHLQELLDAVIDQLYHEHVHRELKTTPRQALGDAASPRLVSLERLREAFLIDKTLTHHKKDRTIRVNGTLFRVPGDVRAKGRKVPIAIDPEDPAQPYLVRRPGVYEPLEPAVQKAGEREQTTEPEKTPEPVGSLTPLLEKYRGRTLPQARAGFGLPEIYQAFSQRLKRAVPATEAEAAAIVDWVRRRGPFDPQTFHRALDNTIQRLGEGRPLLQLLETLDRRIRRAQRKDPP